jgi:hypothetical protein
MQKASRPTCAPILGGRDHALMSEPEFPDDQEPDHDTICLLTDEQAAKLYELLNNPEAFMALLAEAWASAYPLNSDF